MRLAGAAYLIYLGVQMLVRRPRHDAARPRRWSSPYAQGLLSNLGNPKMAVFFTSLLPQFGGDSFAALLALGFLFCTMTFAWLTSYAFAVARAGDFLRRSRVRVWLDRATGAVLVALGVRIATEAR